MNFASGVPPDYDSMIGKLIVHADSREAALNRMSRALAEFRVETIKICAIGGRAVPGT